jgi:hypothetical protein
LAYIWYFQELLKQSEHGKEFSKRGLRNECKARRQNGGKNSEPEVTGTENEQGKY